jgi:hypothetical protein
VHDAHANPITYDDDNADQHGNGEDRAEGEPVQARGDSTVEQGRRHLSV